MTMFATLLLIYLFLAVGAYGAAVLDEAMVGWQSGMRRGSVWSAPLYRAAAMLSRQSVETEKPDAMNAWLAPVWYLALAAIGLTVVPFGEALVAYDLSTGLVAWGAVESLMVVVIFLHGWSPNSPFPLIGAYRYVAIGLPIMLLSMFVLIAAALPAQSLDVREVVASQRDIWNVIRQPLGLPLFLFLGLSLTLRGPLDYGDSADLAGGTSAEESGAARALWQLARLVMLVSFSTMAATVFLGGYLGPVLPGPVWLGIKSAAVLALLVLLTHILARTSTPRMMGAIWKLFLPIAFVALLQAGLVALT